MLKYLALLPTLLLALAPLTAQAQTAPLDVQEVRTDAFPRVVVRLRESPDATQAALQADQLEVLENGQPQPSAEVRELRNPVVPTSVALAIDVSGSMADQGKFTAAQSAARDFASQIRPIDKVAVVSFADEVIVPQSLTTDRQLINRSIDQLVPGGNTSLYDAVAQGLTQLSLSPSGSRALVVLTDGNDTASERSVRDDISQAVQMAVPIYAIGLGADADTQVLQQFASETGGQYYPAPTARDLADVFRLISRQLGAEYQVSWISTSGDSVTKDVQITLARADQTHTSTTISYTPPAYATHSASTPAFQALQEIAPTLAPTEQQAAIAGVLAGIGVFTLAFGIVRRRRARRLHTRLAATISGSPLAQSPTRFALSSRSHLSPVTAATATFTGRLLPSRLITYLRGRLVLAGYPSDRHLGTFLAAEAALAPLLGFLTYVEIQSNNLLSNPFGVLGVTVLAALCGGYMPYMWLRRKCDARQRSLMRALPDALDLMVISVTAGLSLDTAVTEVVRKWDGDLSREFNQVLNEMRMGVSRRDALRNFADRTRLQDIQMLVAALLQADETGSDISEVLSSQADQLRIRRHHLAEELARKAPIKMIFPMVLFIFPALFAVILAPGFLQISAAFASFQHA